MHKFPQKIALLTSAALLTNALSAPAASVAPATAPASSSSAPAAPLANYSEPKESVKSFLKAKDEAGMRNALIFAPESKDQSEAFLGVMIATTSLQNIARDHFGPASADKYFSKSTDDQLAARLAQVDKAEVKTEGDTAAVMLPADEASKQSAGTIILKKIGADWKIDAASLFGITPDKANVQRVQLANALTTVTKQLISDIAANKYSSASDAYQDYWTRSKAAIDKLTATSAATSPATKP